MVKYYANARSATSNVPVLNNILYKNKADLPQKKVVEVYADVYKKEVISPVNSIFTDDAGVVPYDNPNYVLQGNSLYFLVGLAGGDSPVYQPAGAFLSPTGQWTVDQIIDKMHEYFGAMFRFRKINNYPVLVRNSIKNGILWEPETGSSGFVLVGLVNL